MARLALRVLALCCLTLLPSPFVHGALVLDDRAAPRFKTPLPVDGVSQDATVQLVDRFARRFADHDEDGHGPDDEDTAVPVEGLNQDLTIHLKDAFDRQRTKVPDEDAAVPVDGVNQDVTVELLDRFARRFAAKLAGLTVDDAAPENLHNTGDFLPWHRGYLKDDGALAVDNFDHDHHHALHDLAGAKEKLHNNGAFLPWHRGEPAPTTAKGTSTGNAVWSDGNTVNTAGAFLPWHREFLREGKLDELVDAALALLSDRPMSNPLQHRASSDGFVQELQHRASSDGFVEEAGHHFVEEAGHHWDPCPPYEPCIHNANGMSDPGHGPIVDPVAAGPSAAFKAGASLANAVNIKGIKGTSWQPCPDYEPCDDSAYLAANSLGDTATWGVKVHTPLNSLEHGPGFHGGQEGEDADSLEHGPGLHESLNNKYPENMKHELEHGPGLHDTKKVVASSPAGSLSSSYAAAGAGAFGMLTAATVVFTCCRRKGKAQMPVGAGGAASPKAIEAGGVGPEDQEQHDDDGDTDDYGSSGATIEVRVV